MNEKIMKHLANQLKFWIPIKDKEIEKDNLINDILEMIFRYLHRID